jgi:hypothetical protein
LGANDRKHNFSYDPYPAKSPEAQDRQLYKGNEDMSPITDSPNKADSHLAPNEPSKKK